MNKMRWQDFTEIVIGLWLISSPLVLGFDSERAALWNAIFVGTAITGAAAQAMQVPAAWEELFNMALGIWLVASPWFLSYYGHGLATMNALVVGGVIILLALWAMVIDKGYQRWYQRTMHAPR